MELDEIIRLKQITGLKDMFSNHKFSKSWDEFEMKLNKEIVENNMQCNDNDEEE